MKDQDYAKLLDKTIKEIRRRYGKACPEIHYHCAGCEAHIAAGILESMLDTVEWSLKELKSK